MTNGSIREETPECRNNHASDDREAICHVIQTHDVSGSYRGESNHTEIGNGTSQYNTTMGRGRGDEEHSELSHMSDYDELGMAPSPRKDHMVLADEDEDGRKTKHVIIRDDVEPIDESESANTMGQNVCEITTM